MRYGYRTNNCGHAFGRDGVDAAVQPEAVAKSVRDVCQVGSRSREYVEEDVLAEEGCEEEGGYAAASAAVFLAVPKRLSLPPSQLR